MRLSTFGRVPAAGGRVLSAASLLLLAACTRASSASADIPSIPAPDSSGLLAPRRIAALPAAERVAWTRYIATSDSVKRWEQDSMAVELRLVGRERMVAAPDVRQNWEMGREMTDAWFATDSARRLADVMLSYQTPAGGWSKHFDMSKGPRQPGTSFFSETDRWSYIGTIDNGSTTQHVRYLARAWRGLRDERYRAAALRGVDYLLQAQMPNGCWPQVWPLQGGYADATTFNDDAVVNVLEVLRDVGRGDGAELGFVPLATRERAAAALERGVGCLVDNQVIVNGARTAWGQQHDPLTRAPVKARSYEHPSLSGRESAGIVAFLMSLPSPDARVVEAVHSAADWFRATAIHDIVYDWRKGELRREPGAGPLWARMAEIGTNRPIFSNRDGIILYDFDRLTDRRTGYGWFSSEPADVLKRYDDWAARHPRAAHRA